MKSDFMKKIVLLFTVLTFGVIPFGARAHTIKIYETACTVKEKGLSSMPAGHYSATCLYAAMAELYLTAKNPSDLEQLEIIMGRIASGDIEIQSSNIISYGIGGQAAPLLALKAGSDFLKEPSLQWARRMWNEQRRTQEGLMTAQNNSGAVIKDGFWIDIAFCVTPFFLYSGLLSGNQEYVDFAAYEILKMYEILYDSESDGLFHQARGINGLDRGEVSQDCWSRGNGWGSMAFEVLLRDYPRKGKYRKEIEKQAKRFYNAVLRYQDPETGLWRQEMTFPGSYIETSGSAQILSGLGQAVASGIIPRKKGMAAYRKALCGLLGYVDPDGSIGHTCIANLVPGKKGEKEAYAGRQWSFNERHAFGPVLLALASALRLGIKEIDLPYPQGTLNDKDRPRAYCRFISERKEDFAWENDRIAFRVYSSRTQKNKSLSGVDMWGKCVDYPIVDKWYRENNAKIKPYHVDAGEGCDFYVIGKSRGAGGSGVWTKDSLYVPDAYSNYRIYSSGPRKADFRLDFQPYNAGDDTIYESKRIEMVCGTSFYKVTHTLESESGNDIVLAVGITSFDNPEVEKGKGTLSVVTKAILADGVVVNGDAEQPPLKEVIVMGGIVADPAAVCGYVSTPTDELMLIKVKSGKPVIYYVGCAWNGQEYYHGWSHNVKRWPAYMEENNYEALNDLYK